MESLKKYWWLFLLIPIGFYLLYVYLRAKKEVNLSTAKAREGKAIKAMLKDVEIETEKTTLEPDGGDSN